MRHNKHRIYNFFVFIIIIFNYINKINGQDIDLPSESDFIADTIFVVKKNKFEFESKKSYNNVFFELKELILKDKNGKLKTLTTSRIFLSVTKDEIIIDFNIVCNRFNQKFFISNFPHIKNQIDTTKHYNTIKIGKIIGRIDKNGNIYYENYFNNDSLLNTNEKKVLEEYQKLSKTKEFSKSDCNNWTKAYILFEKITWLTIIKNTFSIEQYNKLNNLLVPCIGQEHGTYFHVYSELLDFIK